jgi:O-methyltransferase involved in polyketide biosynthesis
MKTIHAPSIELRESRISPTAIAALAIYAKCGIPLAQEFLGFINSDKIDASTRNIATPQGLPTVDFFPMLEARYRSTDGAIKRLIEERGIETVLEFASGISPVGLALVRDYPIMFIETDISDEFLYKPELCRKVMQIGNIQSRGAQQFYKLNAVTMIGFTEVEKELQPGKPIILTNSGLVTYLSIEDQEKFASNIKRIMYSRPGSLWITADISLHCKDYFDTMSGISPAFEQQWNDMKAGLRAQLNIDLDETTYANEQQARAFYEQRGFKVTKMDKAELGFDLISESFLTLDLDKKRQLLDITEKTCTAWILELREGTGVIGSKPSLDGSNILRP